MGGPGPSQAELSTMLALAARVPDHGKLNPWRFIVFAGEARNAIGLKFATRWQALHPEHGDEAVAFQSGLFLRAPLVVVVVSTAMTHPKIPVWEQKLSAAAVCFNLVLSAQAHGFDAQWQTDWVAYDKAAQAAMGVTGQEEVAGMIYIGKSSVPLEERPRPDTVSLTTYWTA